MNSKRCHLVSEKSLPRVVRLVEKGDEKRNERKKKTKRKQPLT